jgi:glycosyltransferase involved in cell wall biosynthesis
LKRPRLRPDCPSVSVVVPSYNYAHYLESCVQSIVSQPGVEVDVLIIDDCSQDDTPAVATRLAENDTRITFRRHEKNLGHIATYNEGLQWASGDYSVVLSADDLLTAGALSRAAAVMDDQPDVGLVYGRSLYFVSNDERPIARSGVPRVDRWDGSDWIAQRCKTATSCISSPEVVVRTSLQTEIGGYRDDLPHSADVEMWLRFAANGDVAYLGRVDQALYRKHPNSMMRTTFADPLIDLQQRKAAFDAVFDSYPGRIRNAEASRALAHRALAREALWRACRAFDRGQLEQVRVDDLEAFAFETYPAAAKLRQSVGLRWRRRLGMRRCQQLQPVILSPLVHRARDWLWWYRWRTRGV